jgi:hypothetical protein
MNEEMYITSGATVISGADNIAAFQIIRLYTALRLQERTGMTLKGGSVIKYVKTYYGVTGRTAKVVADNLKLKYPDILKK